MRLLAAGLVQHHGALGAQKVGQALAQNPAQLLGGVTRERLPFQRLLDTMSQGFCLAIDVVFLAAGGGYTRAVLALKHLLRHGQHHTYPIANKCAWCDPLPPVQTLSYTRRIQGTNTSITLY